MESFLYFVLNYQEASIKAILSISPTTPPISIITISKPLDVFIIHSLISSVT